MDYHLLLIKRLIFFQNVVFILINQLLGTPGFVAPEIANLVDK